jgi:hypothetical protein
MNSKAIQSFGHAIQDAIDLLDHFDSLNKNPPPPQAEVLKRASLVMALAALETYMEDRITEAAASIAGHMADRGRLASFYISSLQNDLKYFHTPSADRIHALFEKYLEINIEEGWRWNNYDPPRARSELNQITKKRGDIAHRSLRPGQGGAHAVTRDNLRKHIRFIRDLVESTDKYLATVLGDRPS